MPNAIVKYVRMVDAVNRRVGRFAMYLVFVMMGVLVYSAISRTFFDLPLIWVVEIAQMTMAAYYLLGGGYSMQLGAHVRMDLLYGRWSPKRRAFTDSITSLVLLFYVLTLLYGGVSSTQYALEYGQKNYSCLGAAHGAHQNRHDAGDSVDGIAGDRHVLQGPGRSQR